MTVPGQRVSIAGQGAPGRASMSTPRRCQSMGGDAGPFERLTIDPMSRDISLPARSATVSTSRSMAGFIGNASMRSGVSLAVFDTLYRPGPRAQLIALVGNRPAGPPARRGQPGRGHSREGPAARLGRDPVQPGQRRAGMLDAFLARRGSPPAQPRLSRHTRPGPLHRHGVTTGRGRPPASVKGSGLLMSQAVKRAQAPHQVDRNGCPQRRRAGEEIGRMPAPGDPEDR